jgi:hypothetical protein
MDVIFGACRCGAVKFEFDPPSKFCVHCHCESCRRSHGAAFVTWIGTHQDRFRLLTGKESLTRYTSSRGATRSFCATCGSMMFFESPQWAGEVHVARSQILGTTDRMPTAHVNFRERVPWLQVTDELHKLDKF